jgi:hypothetical protein
MTTAVAEIVHQIEFLSDGEVNYLWDFLAKRRNRALLDEITNKLDESKDSQPLTDEERDKRLKKLGII